MNKILLGLSGLLLLSSVNSFGQDFKKCNLTEVKNQLFQNHPEFKEIFENEQARIKLQASKAKTTQSVFKVPVVFHIVLTTSQQTAIGGMSGIIKRIDSQMVVLNRDFNRKNFDTTNMPAVFKPVFGNAGIEFYLAHKKPNGQSTNGYEIITTTQTSFDGFAGTYGSGYFCSNVKYTASGGANSWDPTKYLNIWICAYDQGDNLLGIATPRTMVGTGSPIPIAEVGVVANYKAFGKRILMADQYINGIDKGRTLTHEIGHYFNLGHIWGELDNCTDDDGIGDTPKQDNANYFCPSGVLANCNNTTGGQMYMNYMDYVDDGCMYMFTQGQVSVMRDFYDNTLIPDESILYFPTAINEVEINNPFDIYPNPNNGNFNVSFANGTGSLLDIKVVNTVGQTVYVQSTNKNTAIYNIDISGLSKGVYFVQCQFEEGKVTRKIVLQ